MRELSDFGNTTLGKRHVLRPELADNGSRVRVRVTDQDDLNRLYWANKLDDIEYSIGLSLQADLWRSAQTGVKAMTLDGAGGGKELGGLPPGMGAMRRLSKALDFVRKEGGEEVVQHLLALVNNPAGRLTEAEVALHIRPGLALLGRFYDRHNSVRGRLAAALA